MNTNFPEQLFVWHSLCWLDPTQLLRHESERALELPILTKCQAWPLKCWFSITESDGLKSKLWLTSMGISCTLYVRVTGNYYGLCRSFPTQFEYSECNILISSLTMNFWMSDLVKLNYLKCGVLSTGKIHWPLLNLPGFL